MAYHSFEDLEVWKRSVDLKTAGGDQKPEVGGRRSDDSLLKRGG